MKTGKVNPFLVPAGEERICGRRGKGEKNGNCGFPYIIYIVAANIGKGTRFRGEKGAEKKWKKEGHLKYLI